MRNRNHTPSQPDARAAAFAAEQAAAEAAAPRGHEFTDQCWAAQGWGCADDCGWGDTINPAMVW